MAMPPVTLGKPGFDEHSKKKVLAAKDISLVEHDAFIEGVLRVRAGKTTPEEFFDWITTSGLVEIDRLNGVMSYEILTEL